MTPWIGLLGLLFGIISPAAGVLFLIPASGKALVNDKKFNQYFFAVWVIISIVFYVIGFVNNIQMINLIFSAGLSVYLLFHFIKKEYDIDFIFMSLLFLNTVYMFIRQLIFAKQIISEYTIAMEDSIMLVSNRFQENSEQYQIFMEMIEISKEFYLKYSPGIWVATMMICLMTGYSFLSKREKNCISLKDYRNHLYIIYTLIVALIFAILTSYKVVSLNYIFALIPLFLFQGLAVINKRIGHWFYKSRALLVIAVLSIILNPYIVLFISVIGLFDNWFDFRSLSQSEETNENNSN